ncbi:hypothetical protein [Xenorhabdus sp. KJ12.1]|uniref:hypothetical protein n=1 Tax=Xenorhabdus sp. KJ12.1 TaxID=1851571 RepID=UPI000C057017|nr:hypothetical protein [Xenorhabdus sp. KJ12.1]PHM72249.1 hypothetical protein Xekj_00527 [Xenorhabdus sp. KJ12.1]
MKVEQEPTIVINGIYLDEGQAMAIRTAVTSYLSYLRENRHGDDEHGKKISELYRDRLSEVQDIMFSHL